MWVLLALGSAFFAAVTSILAKIGMDNVDSNLAVAIRTVVVTLMAWLIVAIAGSAGQISELGGRAWLFLVLSGIATGASWLCFFAALKFGPVSLVVPIDKFSVVLAIVMAVCFLGEAVTWKVAVGGALVTIGMLVMVL